MPGFRTRDLVSNIGRRRREKIQIRNSRQQLVNQPDHARAAVPVEEAPLLADGALFHLHLPKEFLILREPAQGCEKVALLFDRQYSADRAKIINIAVAVDVVIENRLPASDRP